MLAKGTEVVEGWEGVGLAVTEVGRWNQKIESLCGASGGDGSFKTK